VVKRKDGSLRLSAFGNLRAERSFRSQCDKPTFQIFVPMIPASYFPFSKQIQLKLDAKIHDIHIYGMIGFLPKWVSMDFVI
jgi:hypothetical protein